MVNGTEVSYDPHQNITSAPLAIRLTNSDNLNDRLTKVGRVHAPSTTPPMI